MGKKGRPNSFETVITPRMEEIIAWARSGATNKEIASALGIGYSTLTDQIKANPDFSDSLREARTSGVPAVKLALYNRAIGFEYVEKKTYIKEDENGSKSKYTEIIKKRALPDVGAIQTYLRNYTEDFRDKDKATYDFKETELELKRMMAEANNF